jgi:hypothetical protein
MTILQRVGALLITLSLAACGGGGGNAGTGNATIGDGSGPGAATKNQLFVGDSNKFAFAVFTTLKPAAGTSIAANVLDIGQLPMWLGMAYDSKIDRLYANDAKVINIFDKASALNGKIAATRIVTPLIPGLTLLNGMQLDKNSDTLYIGYATNSSTYAVAVFPNATNMSGNVAPSRVMTGVNAGYFVVDTQHNILYTKDRSSAESKVYAFPDQSMINGAAPFATRKTLSLPLGSLAGLALDTKHDRLYVGVLRSFSASGGVGVVEAASTRGTVNAAGADHTPASLISLPNGALGDIGLAYDPNNDRLYAGLDNNVYILDTVSTLQAGTPANAVLVTAPTGSYITTFAFP